tara:strand:- start:279 stop:452 length:174 start_codon:yes stop_codon:yes gene_type:complete
MFQDIILYGFIAVIMYAMIRVLIETMIAEWGIFPTVLLIIVSVVIGIGQHIVENNSQ